MLALSAITRLDIVSSTNRLIPSTTKSVRSGLSQLLRVRFYHTVIPRVIIEFICERDFVTEPITAGVSRRREDRSFRMRPLVHDRIWVRSWQNGNSFLAPLSQTSELIRF